MQPGRSIVLLFLLACLPVAGGVEAPVVRHTLSIAGLAPEPIRFEARFDLRIPVIEFNTGGPFLSKAPGDPSSVGEVSFVLPEIDDKVLVIFQWMQRILTEGVETHPAIVTGYDARGIPLVTWRLESAWPSEMNFPALGGPDNPQPGFFGPTITLQCDRLTLNPPDSTAPFPELFDVTHDPAARTFTMIWRSVAGATYDIYCWDQRAGSFVETESGLTATGPSTSFTAPLREAGLYYARLTNPPTVDP